MWDTLAFPSELTSLAVLKTAILCSLFFFFFSFNLLGAIDVNGR